MTRTCVALIRGINVGKAKRVPMADLRAAFERLGFENVRTLLNSGNVVFTAALSPKTAAARIERALEKDIGVPARALVLTADELEEAVSGNGLTRFAANPSRLLVGFLWEPAALLAPLRKRDWGNEALELGRQAAYLWCPEGFETPLVKAFQQAAGTGVTIRNWSTVLKLQALVQEPGPAAGPRRRAAPRKNKKTTRR